MRIIGQDRSWQKLFFLIHLKNDSKGHVGATPSRPNDSLKKGTATLEASRLIKVLSRYLSQRRDLPPFSDRL